MSADTLVGSHPLIAASYVVNDPADWFYIRAASIARKVYCKGNMGVGALRKSYCGAKNDGTKRQGLTRVHCSDEPRLFGSFPRPTISSTLAVLVRRPSGVLKR